MRARLHVLGSPEVFDFLRLTKSSPNRGSRTIAGVESVEASRIAAWHGFVEADYGHRNIHHDVSKRMPVQMILTAGHDQRVEHQQLQRYLPSDRFTSFLNVLPRTDAAIAMGSADLLARCASQKHLCARHLGRAG